MLTIQLLGLVASGWLVTRGRAQLEGPDATALQVCPRHAYYTRCGHHNCGDLLTCARPTVNEERCKMSKLCVPGCVCGEGYLMNSRDLCVRPHRCDVSPPCGTNEVFDFHPRSEDRRCADVIDGIYLPRLPYYPPGCRCKPGYVRDNSYSCVPPKICLNIGGHHRIQ